MSEPTGPPTRKRRRGRPPAPDIPRTELRPGTAVWVAIRLAEPNARGVRPIVGAARGRVVDLDWGGWRVLVTHADGPCCALVGTDLVVPRDDLYAVSSRLERDAFGRLARELK